MRAAPELRISGRRRNEIKKAVVALLRECGVNTLPVCLQKITEKKQWIPVEYAVARRSGLEIPSPCLLYTSRMVKMGRTAKTA